jgi:hypothetical protein
MDVADLGSVRAALADIDGSSGKPRQFGSPPGMARSLSRRPTANPMPRWLPARKPRRRTVRGTPGVSRGSGRRIRPMGGSDSSGVANHAQAGRPSSERRSRPLGYSPVSRHPRRASPFRSTVPSTHSRRHWTPLSNTSPRSQPGVVPSPADRNHIRRATDGRLVGLEPPHPDGVRRSIARAAELRPNRRTHGDKCLTSAP